MVEIPKYLAEDPTFYTGNPPANSLKQELPFDELLWENFERLCLRLAKEQSNVESCRLYGGQGDNQEGIDIYAKFSGAQKYAIYQCKREKNFGPQKIEDAVNTFLAGEWVDKTEQFFLCTQESLRSKVREDEIIVQRAILSKNGIELIIWDREELSVDLKKYPQLVYDFFDLHWCEAFCGTEVAKSTIKRKSLPPKRLFKPIEGHIERMVIKVTSDTSYDTISTRKSLHELIKAENRIALLGPANNGKSTELNQLAYRLAGETSFYPYLVRLKNQTTESIKDYIPELGEIPQSQIVVLLDGLDEVQSGQFDSSRRKIQKFNEDFPSVRLVVSCRTNFYVNYDKDDSLNTLQGFSAYKLKDLTELQVDEFLNHVSSVATFDKQRFLAQVQARRFGNLVYIPHYLNRLVAQFKEEGVIANNIAEITERLIRENIQKDVVRYFPNTKGGKEQLMYETLRKIAFTLEYSGKNYCTWPELQSLLTESEVELVKATSSTIEGSESPDGRWSFILNNIQEVLAALNLKDESVTNIRKTICAAPDYSRVKPTWANTVALLISVLETKKRQEMISWLYQDHLDLIIRFEPDVVDELLRVKVLRDIFENYSNKGTRINETIYSKSALALFSKSVPAANFLLENLKPELPRMKRVNSLVLISFYNIQVEFPALAKEFKSLVEQNIYGPDSITYHAIRAYAGCFELSEPELSKLFNTFSKSDDTWTLSALYWAIYNQGKQEPYLKDLLRIVKEFMNQEFSDRENRLADEHMLLRECVTGVKSKDANIELLDFIKANYDQLSYSIYFKEIIDFTVKTARTFNDDQVIYKKVKDIFVSEEVRLEDNRNAIFLEYFKETGQILTIFKDFYTLDPQLSHSTSLQLAILADDVSLDFFIDEFKGKRVSRESILLFQNYLANYQRGLLVDFNRRINEVENIPLPVFRDYETEKRKQNELTKEVLFDKDRFAVKLNEFFTIAGKDELTYDEMWNQMYRGDRQNYPPVLFDAIRVRDRQQVIKKDVLLDRLNIKWDRFSIEEIYRFLKGDKTIELSEAEKQIIKNWCDAQLQTLRFTEANKRTDQGYSTNNMAIFASFFIRRFNFRHYPEHTYLDMLSMQKWDDDDIDLFPFVSTVMAQDKIDSRVLENLRSTDLFPVAYENHLTYCKERQLTSAANLLIPFIRNPKSHKRHETLQCFKLLNGDLAELEKSLDLIQDDFKFDVIQLLIEHGSGIIKAYVRKQFKESNDVNLKIRYAFWLVQLQSLSGIKYFIRYIKEHKQIPDLAEATHSNLLEFTKELKFLPFVFQVYRLGYDEIKQGPFFSLHHMAATALRSICLNGDNFPMAKRIFHVYRWLQKIQYLVTRDERIQKTIIDFEFYFENAEQQYYINKGTTIQFKDAIQKFAAIQKRKSR